MLFTLDVMLFLKYTEIINLGNGFLLIYSSIK